MMEWLIGLCGLQVTAPIDVHLMVGGEGYGWVYGREEGGRLDRPTGQTPKPIHN